MGAETHERADPTNFLRISPDVRIGRNVTMHCFVNLYGCEVGDDSRIGSFVEIQKNVSVGARCKIQSHTFICEGVTIEDEVFVGHGVMFINDRDPRATSDGAPQTEDDWSVEPTRVCRGASLGSGSVILGGPIVTAGGLVIAGGSSDRRLHVFDVETGKEVFTAELPASAHATPMTYEAGGRQYVVIAAGGGAKITEERQGDALVAFALPAPSGR